MKTVPFLDLSAQYAVIREEIGSSMDQVFDSVAFVGGPFVESFEKEFANFCGCGYAAGTSNGTSALWMTLLSLGIGQGDEVITVPNTFIATAEAITFSGARPVFVDVEERSHTMNPALLEKAISSKTKAVIPVHLFGQSADMDPIMEIARKHGLFVVEDACQAHGAKYKGKAAGTIGEAGCFSFYPGKNLGAYGEAGAVVTNNPELAEKIRIIKNHGQSKKYYHRIIGWNGRMDGMQGAVLSVKLKYLTTWNEERRKNAKLYGKLLSDLEGISLPREMDYAHHVYHLYVIRTRHRDYLKDLLEEKGITCGIHYPVPVHLQEAYCHLGMPRGSFPVAEKCAKEILSLPMYPELTAEQIEYVAEELRNGLIKSSK